LIYVTKNKSDTKPNIQKKIKKSSLTLTSNYTVWTACERERARRPRAVRARHKKSSKSAC
jgi:hypothetical protein